MSRGTFLADTSLRLRHEQLALTCNYVTPHVSGWFYDLKTPRRRKLLSKRLPPVMRKQKVQHYLFTIFAKWDAEYNGMAAKSEPPGESRKRTKKRKKTWVVRKITRLKSSYICNFHFHTKNLGILCVWVCVNFIILFVSVLKMKNKETKNLNALQITMIL